MKISRSVAALVVAAGLAVFSAGCGSGGGAPGTGASTTAAPSAPAAGSPSTPAPVTTAPAATTPGGPAQVPRCRTSQLTAAYTGLNGAAGGGRGMTLILTNHSGSTCYVYGYPGLAFFNSGGIPMATHLTWMKAPHATVILHSGGNAQAMLTWRVNMDTATPFNPSIVHVTPPDEYAYLWSAWQGGPVLGGNITAWPLEAAPAGPFPAGTGTIADPFNGMCVALASDGATVVAWKCSPGAASQQWTGYNDGTLRIAGKCMDVTGPKVGATVKVAACTGAGTQKWVISQVSANDFGAIYNPATGNVLTDPASSTVNGTRLVMGPDNGDLSYPWRVSYYHYMSG